MKYAVTAVLIAAALATPVLAKERHVKVSPEAAAAQASVPGAAIIGRSTLTSSSSMARWSAAIPIPMCA